MTSTAYRMGLVAWHIVKSSQPVVQPVRPEHSIPDIYDRLAYAETGAYDNPWIRTMYAPQQGSTAWGPLQITTTMLADYHKRYPQYFKGLEADVERMLAQGRKFNQYGRNPNARGYDPRYDYGGTGDFDNHDAYRNIAYALIRAVGKETNWNTNAMVQRWRGVGEDRDPEYFEKFRSYVPKPPGPPRSRER